MSQTIRISNQNSDVWFDLKFEPGMKKIWTELSNIFYCSKIEFQNSNICWTILAGPVIKTKFLLNYLIVIFKNV